MTERSQPNSAHTPTPWSFNHNGHYFELQSERDGQVGDVCASQTIYHEHQPLAPDVCKGIAEANAALIVKAVNNHAEMVRILKAIDKSWLETFDRGPDGDYGGVALAEEHKTFWRDVRAVLSSMGEIEL